MELLMLFPPQWTPVAPSIGIPILRSQLEKAGFKVAVKDLNIELFDDILTENYLTQALTKAELILANLSEEIKKNKYSMRKIKKYPIEIQTLLHKHQSINDYFKANKKEKIQYIIKSIDEAKSVFRDKEKFYDINKLLFAQMTANKALRIAFLPYAPTRITFEDYINPLLKLSYENIKHHCFDETTNMFLEYYPEKIKSLITEKTKYVGISINSTTQFIPGLTLAHMIKKEYNLHVNIGGDYFRRIVDDLKKYPEFFDLFCDSILIEDSEDSIIELARFVNNEISIEKVSGLIYKDDQGKINVTEIRNPAPLDDMADMHLEGFDLRKYFTPELVLPLKSNRHCIWDKCAFCDLYFGGKYNEKSHEILLREIKSLQKKYNISHFEFIDSSLSAKYYKEFAEIIKRDDVDIKFFSFARLEKAFTKELFKDLYNAGLRMLLWGYESSSERIIKLMNKGVKFEGREQIIIDSDETGIWNSIFTMFGFPTETMKEAMHTVKTVSKYANIMNPQFSGRFMLCKGSKVINSYKDFGIVEITDPEEDFVKYKDYKTKKQLSFKQTDKLRIAYKNSILKALKNKRPVSDAIRLREHFFLYLTRYGINWVKNAKFIIKK